jgi:LysM repeat protein
MKNKYLALVSTALIATSCSPLRTSPNDEGHNWELKFHEIRTNLEEVKHDVNCFRTDLQILENRIQSYETTLSGLKKNDLDNQAKQIDQISQTIRALEKQWSLFEQDKQQIQKLGLHANETILALSQCKTRIQELDQKLVSQNKKFEDLAKIKGNLDAIAKNFKSPYTIYEVKSGDSLERIAAAHNTKADKIKKLNELEKDTIFPGQQLKIPTD